MNILFLSLLDFESLEEHNIYTDLLRKFVKKGNNVYVISPNERRKGKNTYLISKTNETILKLKIGNVQKTNFVEKGISTITLEGKYVKGIKKYFNDVKFDLVLYTTPPITLLKAVEFVKKRDGAKTYLMLKDIFPQNAVDIGILSNSGIKGVLHRYFRNKEKKLYRTSDYIGCMSLANADYIKKHNPAIEESKIEICPNCMEPVNHGMTKEEKVHIRKQYDIPTDKLVFVYGGNLGKPQGITFMLECLKNTVDIENIYFLIVGSGTEYPVLEDCMKQKVLTNVKLIQYLPKEQYEKLVAACDVGMIFLDYKFTIPNFPSRLLSYMDAELPVLAVTDKNTDIRDVIEDYGFGWWCESKYVSDFRDTVMRIQLDDIIRKGKRGKEYLLQNYTVNKVVQIIENHMKDR